MNETQLRPHDIETMLHSVVQREGIVAIADRAGTIVHVNDRFCELSGYGREELLGQNHRLLKSGIQSGAFYKTLWNTILAGRVWRGEICNRAKDGHLFWFETLIVPQLAGDVITHFVALCTETTARKTAEEERRMAALGRMADGVLHDLGNILTGVLGLAGEARTDARNALLLESVQRMVHLTRTLRDYSAGRPSKPAPFRLLPVLTCACSLIRYGKGVPWNLTVIERHDAVDCEIVGNEAQVFEVVLNLAVNAVEAVAGLPKPEVRVTSALTGDRVEIRVEDNGGGVPPRIAASIFEPYTSSKGRGRGLGLSVAQRIAKAHGGELRLEFAGAAGRGACFLLALPARRVAPGGSKEGEGTGPRRMVLVAEPDPEVRNTIESAANACGLAVLYPGDNADLLALASKMGDGLAAAVIDSGEPDSDQGIVACLRRIAPGLPILLVSDTVVRRETRLTPWGGIEGFPKSFPVGEMAAALEAAIRAQGSLPRWRSTGSP